MTAPELAPGQIVAGRFAIRRALGRGELTATYHALTMPARDVAVKVFDPVVRDRHDVLDFLRRVTIETNALPPSVALRILEAGDDPTIGAPFVVSELCVTPSLAELVKLCPLAGDELAAFASNLCDALDVAHARGLLHLSLAPGNVFVGPPPTCEVKLGDFGLSVLTSPGAPGAYGAPEQLAEPTVASDVYAAALVILYAASGVTLDDRSDDALAAPASAAASQRGEPVDSRLDEPLARALARNPSARFASALDLAEAVATALGAPPPRRRESARLAVDDTAAPPVPRIEPTPASARYAARESVAPPALRSQAPPGEATRRPPPLPKPPSMPRIAEPAFVMPDAIEVPDASPGLAVPLARPAPRRSLGLVLAAAVGVPLLTGVVVLVAVVLLRRPPPEPIAVVTASSARIASAGGTVGATSAAATAPTSAPSARESGPTVTDTATKPEPGANGGAATLDVVCVPECQAIEVDGKKVRAFPVPVEPGQHFVSAARGVHPVQTKSVTVGAGQNEKLQFVFYAPKGAPDPKKNCGKFLKRCD